MKAQRDKRHARQASSPTPETPRELFRKVMRFECPGRTLATLGGIWQSTLDRWHAEGMPAELKTIPDLIDYFGLARHIWEGPRASLLTYPHFERKVLRETGTTVTYVNWMGVVCTEFKTDAYKSMPHFEEFPIKTRQDWDSYKERLAWSDERVGKEWAEQKARWQASDLPVIAAINRTGSLYGTLRDLIGVERLSYLFYDDPRWVEEMMDTMLELFLHAMDALFTDVVPDAICLWEDMAYRSGSLLSIRHVRDMMLPRYRVMVRKAREKRIPVILLDSDGYIGELIPIWLEAGMDGVVPMEAQSGMDVALYREKYPRLLMMGGVDKRALARDRGAIDYEIDKIRRTIATGGLIPFFDHGLPHDASYANFLYFVERLKEVAQGR